MLWFPLTWYPSASIIRQAQCIAHITVNFDQFCAAPRLICTSKYHKISTEYCTATEFWPILCIHWQYMQNVYPFTRSLAHIWRHFNVVSMTHCLLFAINQFYSFIKIIYSLAHHMLSITCYVFLVTIVWQALIYSKLVTVDSHPWVHEGTPNPCTPTQLSQRMQTQVSWGNRYK